MKNTPLIEQAENTMIKYVCRDLDGEERARMSRLVHRFFNERVSNLNTSDVFVQMATPMKALAWFNSYLCDTIWRSCGCATLADGSNTCQLA